MTYQNPVYRHSCPDPFVLKHCGEYWGYCTGIQPDERAFGILHSPDLIHWEYQNSAMDLLPGHYTCYWAPEVTYRDGIFYLYYSVGNEERMHIRVATAENPAGPFLDSGHRLTNDPFAIDAHVFQNDDGREFLFYAVDFLEGERVGTGTVMDRLLDPFTLAGETHIVTRAHYDWQIYDPERLEKGGMRWHTIEGSFVLKHRDRYYQMFSGGNWQNKTYGVAYATTDRLDIPCEWTQISDGETVFPILRSMPETGVIGPGHNSVVRGPDNQQLYCIYHRWQPETSERVMALDRLGWEGMDLKVYGPSTTPQPLPPQPALSGFEGFQCLPGLIGNEMRLEAGETASTNLPDAPQGYILEINLRAESETGSLQLSLEKEGKPLARFELHLDQRQVVFESASGPDSRSLPLRFALKADHLLRIENDGGHLHCQLDGSRLVWKAAAASAPTQIVLTAQGTSAVFSGFAWTLRHEKDDLSN